MATIGNGPYKVQLLLAEDAARFVRKLALKAATENADVTSEEEDYAYAIIAEIAAGLRR